MNKIIAIFVILFALFVVSPSSSYSQTKDRLKIVVRWFDQPRQAELLISQYTAQTTDWAEIVDDDPDYILEVINESGFGEIRTSWTQVDQKAKVQNKLVRSAQRSTDRAIRRMPGHSWWANILKDMGRDTAREQLRTYVRPEQYRYQTLRSSVTVQIKDARTREIVSKAIGVETITIRTAKQYGYEPLTVLVDGDLSSVGIAPGENLNGTYRQLLQLAAFRKANLPENQIIGKK